MNQRIEQVGAKQVRCQLEHRTTAMAPDRVSQTADDARHRCGLRGGALIRETQERFVVQGNVHWLSVKVLNGKVDSKLLCAMDDIAMRALDDRAEQPGPVEHPRRADASRSSWDTCQDST